LFDIVMQFTVFTSIPDSDLKHRIAAEMCRLPKPDDQLIWYDYQNNKPRNPNVRGVGKPEKSGPGSPATWWTCGA
jgi:hypothetical protein